MRGFQNKKFAKKQINISMIYHSSYKGCSHSCVLWFQLSLLNMIDRSDIYKSIGKTLEEEVYPTHAVY